MPPNECCGGSEAKGKLAYESTDTPVSRQASSSRLMELADQLEQVCNQYAAVYREAVRNPDTDERTIKRANEVTARAQSSLTSMRRAQIAHAMGEEEDPDQEAQMWEHMYTGHTRRFTNFAAVIRKVMMEASIVRHWKRQTRHDTDPATEPRIGTEDEVDVPAHEWNSVDIFKLAEVHSQPLVRLFASIWKARGWDNVLTASRRDCLSFVSALEDAYKNDNPYHNRTHAADVVQASFYFLKRLEAKGDMMQFCGEFDFLVLVVAAALHDVGHPALTNDFVVKTHGALALRYNDKSVLENFHAATGFELMQKMGVSLVDHVLPSPRPSALRGRIVDMVLATDMAVHKQVLESLAAQVTKHESVQDVDKLVLEQAILHMADISHPLRPNALHREWTNRVTQEFFALGDMEKSAGFEPIALYDRDRAPSTAKGQLGFLTFVVTPMWKAMAPVFDVSCDEPDACLLANTTAWEAEALEEDELEAQRSASHPASFTRQATRWNTPGRSRLASAASAAASAVRSGSK